MASKSLDITYHLFDSVQIHLNMELENRYCLALAVFFVCLNLFY